jgi:hypothetical protein
VGRRQLSRSMGSLAPLCRRSLCVTMLTDEKGCES